MEPNTAWLNGDAFWSSITFSNMNDFKNIIKEKKDPPNKPKCNNSSNESPIIGCQIM